MNLSEETSAGLSSADLPRPRTLIVFGEGLLFPKAVLPFVSDRRTECESCAAYGKFRKARDWTDGENIFNLANNCFLTPSRVV
jgi:hypothetical protein